MVEKAAFYATHQCRAATKAEVEEVDAEYRKRATQLREVATKLRGETWQEALEHAAAIEAAAAFCEEQADMVWGQFAFTPGLLAPRNQGDLFVRGYCVTLAEATREIYGKELRGIVAEVTNCAMGITTVTDQRVRDWLSGGSGV
jgi:hypothetical protein